MEKDADAEIAYDGFIGSIAERNAESRNPDPKGQLGMFVPPTRGLTAFSCPHCGELRNQDWIHNLEGDSTTTRRRYILSELSATKCDACHQYTLWINGDPVHPDDTSAEPPHEDMPGEAREVYKEAASIVKRSPRAAATLLRLCLELLTTSLGAKGSSLNARIGDLVSKGLRDDIRKALDGVRVVGNNAIHPSQIDLNEDPEICLRLFKIVNAIVVDRISIPKSIGENYDHLTIREKDQISKRDGQT